MANNIFTSIIRMKCPRCRKGDLFLKKNPYKNITHTNQMPDTCPVCGQATSLEPGFYWGASFISYPLAVLLSGFVFAIYYLLVNITELRLIIIFMLVDIAAILSAFPLIMRYSRVLFIYIFVPYEPS